MNKLITFMALLAGCTASAPGGIGGGLGNQQGNQTASCAVANVPGCCTSNAGCPDGFACNASKFCAVIGGADVSADVDGSKDAGSSDTGVSEYCLDFCGPPPGPQAQDTGTYTCGFSPESNPCLQQLPASACTQACKDCTAGLSPLATWEMCTGAYYCVGIPKSKVCGCTNNQYSGCH